MWFSPTYNEPMAEICSRSTTDGPGHTSVDVTDVCTINGPARESHPVCQDTGDRLERVSSWLRSPQFPLSAGHTCSHHPTNVSLELPATGPSVLSLLVKPVRFETSGAGSLTKARNACGPMRAVETRVSTAGYSEALPPPRFPSWPLVGLRPRKPDGNRTVLRRRPSRRGSLAPGPPDATGSMDETNRAAERFQQRFLLAPDFQLFTGAEIKNKAFLQITCVPPRPGELLLQ